MKIKSCYLLAVCFVVMFILITCLTRCRWMGPDHYRVNSRINGGLSFSHIEINGGSQHTSHDRNDEIKDELLELDGTIEESDTKRTVFKENRPYKLDAVKDSDLLIVIKEIEEERKRMLKENEAFRDTMKGYKEPDIDHRNVQVYDLSTEIKEDFQCIRIHVKPLTPICVYDPKEDVYVSRTLTTGEVWEQHIVKRFQKVLQQNPDICVIDLGANIGQYSLIAANMGHQVLAVEPYLPSLKRFHKGIQIGNFSARIKVLQNAVTDHREECNIKANVDNQGDARVFPLFYDQCGGNSCQKVKTIHMNDLIPYIPSKECILKLDIQGLEHKAFEHSQLLLDTISIPYIFMEWSVLREFYVTEYYQSEDKILVNKIVNLLTDSGYTVYSLVSGRKLKIKSWHGWPEDVLWIQENKVSVEDLGLWS